MYVVQVHVQAVCVVVQSVKCTKNMCMLFLTTCVYHVVQYRAFQRYCVHQVVP